MDNHNNPSSSSPYYTGYGYPHVPPPYPIPNSAPYPPSGYPPPPPPSSYDNTSHSGPLYYQYPPPNLPPSPSHSGPLGYSYPPPPRSSPQHPYPPYQTYPPPQTANPSCQPGFQHQGGFQYGSPHHHHQPFSPSESYSNVPSRASSFSSQHHQDCDNCNNYGEKTPMYPPIDDLLSNVHMSDNAGSVPASLPVPAAHSVSSSPMVLHSQSAKYETEGDLCRSYNTSVSGKWDASHSGPVDSPSHPTLSHSSSFLDSPHSQSLQVVPFSTSKGSLKVLLLHGNLDIWVHEAKNLPNMDMFHKTLGEMFSKLPGNVSSKIEGTINHKITSKPYVSISISGAVIGRTYVISNSEDAAWMQQFYVPVAHYAAEVHFLVKSDVGGSQLMGVVAIPVEQIYSGAKVQGLYPILSSNGKPCKPGALLSLSIQYIPIDIDNSGIYHHGVGAGPDYFGVPGTYFPLRRGGTVTLYQDAHVPDDFFPNLNLDRGTHYVQGKCWRDIFDAIRQARRLVYITGWSVWHQVRLVRDADDAAVYTLGDLLKSKSQEGVRVLLLVWDDPTSRSILGYKTDGFMHTHDEETREFFKHSSVHVLLCPRTAGKKHSWIRQGEVGIIYTHHQKTVIVDAIADNNRRKIIAFLGGLDLCDGRYDTPQHPIFRTLRTVHSDDYHNPTYTGNVAGCPREPWHDLHCKIEGPAAYDVLTNFEERWLKASKPHGIKKLKMSYDDCLLRIDRMPDIAGVIDTPCVSENDPEGWHVQIFRSIDSNSVRKFPNDPKEAISKAS
ncbi:hypothetical protein RHMOL_Rhmol07G0025300 [Rhododendron molle]|uniref:Uncharacterized protein n=1 Tax=Rhododendron molle TaxID=49168 RepID=A0ACC0MWE3_RHOML|nr:hypothetical protein RHMOL_Rhmol07G0025300 [Rhododendron molle]